jgi:protein suppressor of PHYA-105 1
MERVTEEMAVNGAVGNEEHKRKDFDSSLKPEDQIFLRSPVTCVSVRSDWLERSENDCLVAMEGKDFSRCVTSLAGSEPPATCSTNDTGLVMEELTVGNYRNQNLDLVSSPNKSKQGQWQYLYQLASGSRGKGVQENLVSADKDQILLRIREELVSMHSDARSLKLVSSKLLDHVPKGISAYMRASEEKIISSNSLSTSSDRLKTLSTSSFSQLFVNKSLKGKGLICGSGTPEACGGFGGAIGDQNDEKLGDVTKVASGTLLKLNANNDQPSTHRIDASGPEPFNNGISLRESLKPGCCILNKVESLLIFRQIVELVDFAHSRGVVLQDLRPSCFFLLPSSRVKYTGSSIAKRELEGEMCQDSNQKRPLEQDEHAYLSLGAKQQRLCEEMNSIRQQPQFTCHGDLRTKTMKETEISISGPEDSGYIELQSQNNSSYQKKSLTTQESVSVTVQAEERWYTSPEELNKRCCTFSSNIYGLGVLLFEVRMVLIDFAVTCYLRNKTIF